MNLRFNGRVFEKTISFVFKYFLFGNGVKARTAPFFSQYGIIYYVHVLNFYLRIQLGMRMSLQCYERARYKYASATRRSEGKRTARGQKIKNVLKKYVDTMTEQWPRAFFRLASLRKNYYKIIYTRISNRVRFYAVYLIVLCG